MKRFDTILTFAIAAALAGCTARTLPLAMPATTATGQPSASVAGGAAGGSPQDETGSLSLNVNWPARTGYGTQVIPTSTNALIITLRAPSATFNSPGGTTSGTGTGAILAQKTIVRAPGATSASETFKLKAANNVSIEVLAYRESAADYVTSSPIARANGNVNIVRSQDSAINFGLTPLYQPAISAMTANFGKPGDTLTLSGANFGEGGTPLPTVLFNAATASAVTRNSSSSLTVSVPTGATTGLLWVQVDGVTSNSNSSFWVMGSLAISAAKASWDTGTPSTSRAVLLGQTLPFSATPTWVVGNGFVNGQAPQPTWSCDNANAGCISSTGLFTAGSTYATGAVSAKLDNGQSSVTSNSLNAVAEDVSVTLQDPGATLGAKGQNSLELTAFNTLSDGATNSLVTFAASAGVSVGSTGVATADFSVNGLIPVSATSQLIAQRVATSSIPVSNYVVSTLAGHLAANGNFGSLDGDALTYAQFPRTIGLAVDKNTGTAFVSRMPVPSGASRTVRSRPWV